MEFPLHSQNLDEWHATNILNIKVYSIGNDTIEMTRNNLTLQNFGGDAPKVIQQ